MESHYALLEDHSHTSNDTNEALELDTTPEQHNDVARLRLRLDNSAVSYLWIGFFYLAVYGNIFLGVNSLIVVTRTKPGLNEDINGIVPRFELQRMLFRNNSRYLMAVGGDSSITTDRDDWIQAWDELMPRGLGLVTVKNAENYPFLPKPIIFEDYPPLHVVAVFHQLQCWHMIQAQMYHLLNEERMSYELLDINNCFEYLIQAITCLSDVALEGQDKYDLRPGTKGYDVQHICRNFEQILDWTEKNRVIDHADDHLLARNITYWA